MFDYLEMVLFCAAILVFIHPSNSKSWGEKVRDVAIFMVILMVPATLCYGFIISTVANVQATGAFNH